VRRYSTFSVLPGPGKKGCGNWVRGSDKPPLGFIMLQLDGWPLIISRTGQPAIGDSRAATRGQDIAPSHDVVIIGSRAECNRRRAGCTLAKGAAGATIIVDKYLGLIDGGDGSRVNDTDSNGGVI